MTYFSKPVAGQIRPRAISRQHFDNRCHIRDDHATTISRRTSRTAPLALGLFLAISMLALGCTSERIDDKDVATLQTANLVALLQADAPPLLVDVRPTDAFARSHIPGAVNMPIHTLTDGIESLREAKMIVVYTDSTYQGFARAATKKLMQLGYRNVHAFLPGLEGWTEAGGQTTSPTE